MNFRLLIPALLLCLPVLTQADEASHKAAALKLVSRIESKEAMLAAFSSVIEPMTKQMEQNGVPAAAIKEVREAVVDWFNKEVNFETIAPKMAELYMQEFSEEELNKVIAFYDTPVGKKLLLKLPTLMQKGAAVGQEQLAGKQADLQKRIVEIMTKYAPGAPGGSGAPAPGGAK